MSPSATGKLLDAPDVDVDVTPAGPKDPASWSGHRATKLSPSSREIKMLRPQCSECAAKVGGKKYLSPGWQDSCPHDPYVSLSERAVTRPTYEDVLDDEGNATGAKRVTGTETIIEYEPRPNWVSISHAAGMNKGRGVDRALRRGYIYPQMLRSPVWPAGIKRRCQFRECFSEDITRYANGWFCRREEAALVRISDSSESYQVDFDERSRNFQRDQVATNAAKVAV